VPQIGYAPKRPSAKAGLRALLLGLEGLEEPDAPSGNCEPAVISERQQCSNRGSIGRRCCARSLRIATTSHTGSRRKPRVDGSASAS